ncbi:tRNA threonylcarbamoyladenosine biosynthesis protein TsaE [bioreactor metagenome]|uniref:tRNA threonylcarbamoyladenosine biosynthesis protein TsaE n=1 Tax=bioreactor metagenome TaxID=1076179 RepID=A0A644ZK84_9ZZZZ
MQIAKEFASVLKAGDTVAMFGDLGAGKTAFVKGIAQALHVPGYVTSPTFTIVNEYRGDLPLYHFDMYRITDEDSLYQTGYFDYIESDGICAIEWCENIVDFLPAACYAVKIKPVGHQSAREITIEKTEKKQ